MESMHVMFAKAHVTGGTSSIPGKMSDIANDDDMLDAGAESEDDAKAGKEVRVSQNECKLAKEDKVSPKNVKRKAKFMFIDESAKEDKNPFLREYMATIGNINSEIA